MLKEKDDVELLFSGQFLFAMMKMFWKWLVVTAAQTECT